MLCNIYSFGQYFHDQLKKGHVTEMGSDVSEQDRKGSLSLKSKYKSGCKPSVERQRR